MKGYLVGPKVEKVELTLDWKEAAYVLACLGASNTSLFRSTEYVGGLYPELRDTLGIEPPNVPDNRVQPVTRLFRYYAAVLDAWAGKRNYSRAKRVAEEVAS